MMKAREGDLIEASQVVFDVKGLVHPHNRIIAFPRYIPDMHGNRKLKGITYSKIYALSERYRFLEKRLPQYLVFDPVLGDHLCEVPVEDIEHHYDPIKRLQELRKCSELDTIESNMLALTKFLKRNSCLPWNKFGISGSLLVQLHNEKSDLDLIVYGEKACARVYDVLKLAKREGNNKLKSYELEGLKTLYDFRSQDTKMSFEDFFAVEQRKALQGKFEWCDFYVRCVKDWSEIDERYGDVVYKSIGYAKIKATVSDDSEAIFTPCRYLVDNVQVFEGTSRGVVAEIVSFRGRFCEQAQTGECVVAQGKVERVQKRSGDSHFRLLLGSRPEDFIVLAR
ncbi:MAG: hypothetical protein JSW72_07080 [Candidatus Bathyarchaeota archaeon]|nr:MAG: hypothetical protein JSW72_07080 [Candidatus Bathyarchaeota archaeon]